MIRRFLRFLRSLDGLLMPEAARARRLRQLMETHAIDCDLDEDCSCDVADA